MLNESAIFYNDDPSHWFFVIGMNTIDSKDFRRMNSTIVFLPGFIEDE